MDSKVASVITTIAELEALYPTPSARAISKRVTEISDAMQSKIEQASLCVIASVGPNGVDCSPRGDPPGDLVKVLDAQTIAIPDRPGSNRLDTAKNIIANGQIGVWLLSPDSTDTVRITGDAHISTDIQLLKQFELDQSVPVTVMVITIREVAVHNDRAIKSSGLVA